MRTSLKTLILLSVIFFNSYAFAEGLADRKINGQRLYDIFKQKGVPEPALKRSLEFMEANAGKMIKVQGKVRPNSGEAFLAGRNLAIKSQYIAIIDYSLPSDIKRLIILDLATGAVTKHYVAHGRGSGVRIASKFSNIDGSKMSSLGFYLGGSTYFGSHGESLNLYGLEKSNDQAAARDIVIHAADYVSQDYVDASGRLGRSWGCPAVSADIIGKMISLFKDGGLIYAYQKDLMAKIKSSPNLQEIPNQLDDIDIDLPDEE